MLGGSRLADSIDLSRAAQTLRDRDVPEKLAIFKDHLGKNNIRNSYIVKS